MRWPAGIHPAIHGTHEFFRGFSGGCEKLFRSVERAGKIALHLDTFYPALILFRETNVKKGRYSLRRNGAQGTTAEILL